MSEPLYQVRSSFFRNQPIFYVFSLLLIVAGVGGVVVAGPLALAATGLGIVLLGYGYLANKSCKLSLMEGEVIYEEGILNKSETELRLESIRSVKLRKSITDRIFGVGTVEIYSAGDDPEITMSGVPDPDKVQDLIRQQSDT